MHRLKNLQKECIELNLASCVNNKGFLCFTFQVIIRYMQLWYCGIQNDF